MTTTSSSTTTTASLIDIATAADRLGVTVRHVRRLVAERRIPFVKWGHLIRFDPTEIDAWVDDARVAAGSTAAAIRRGPTAGGRG